jgi:hypothetical protein
MPKESKLIAEVIKIKTVIEVKPGIELSKNQFTNKIPVKMTDVINDPNPKNVIILKGLTEKDVMAVNAVLVIANKFAVLFPLNLGSLS